MMWQTNEVVVACYPPPFIKSKCLNWEVPRMSRFLEGGVKFLRIQWHILDPFISHHVSRERAHAARAPRGPLSIMEMIRTDFWLKAQTHR